MFLRSSQFGRPTPPRATAGRRPEPPRCLQMPSDASQMPPEQPGDRNLAFKGKGSHLLEKKNRRRQPGDRNLASKGKGGHFLTKKSRRRQPGDRILASKGKGIIFWRKKNAGGSLGIETWLRGTKNMDFSKSLGMASPGVENVGGPRGSILELSRASQLPYNKKI